ncbi:unnamed protein product [Brassicogethes aeneus]|uniref:Innexin n=1 Tax=Brassicogethes aeneus TaxID=1431903 RepID=A0A9P0BA93_BRAAE|nr:unnamed protein product [Brassicogethes aeneus]
MCEKSMSFLNTFDSIKKFGPFKPHSVDIDNIVFKLHYRVTVAILLVCSVLVTSRQYIGEHIRCLTDKSIAENVINTYCFFMSTFTVNKHHDAKMVDSFAIPHPGVGPYGIGSKEAIQNHTYYQWVPFVLFFQALMFYVTRKLWKVWEGNRIKNLADTLEATAYSYLDKPLEHNGVKIPSSKEREEAINRIKLSFVDRLYVNRSWARYLIICEILNVLHVIVQFYLTDKFLNNSFLTLGFTMMREGINSSVTVFDRVFPKVTKCSFRKYGPSGSIQEHDTMCIMALNIINEKIYGFLWFWFVFLLFVSAMGLIWRILTFILYSRSRTFNRIVYSNTSPGKLNPWNGPKVTYYSNFSEWLFLKYLSKNVDGLVFKEIVLGIAEDIQEKKPLASEYNNCTY